MGTILVVDDEPLVLALLKRVLADSGFNVIEASSGPEAMEIVRGLNGGIDVLLTDLKMPEMSGQELGSALTAAYPSVPVIYMSGYYDRASAGLDSLCGSVAFLQKPFSRSSLLAALLTVIPEAVNL